MAGETPLDLAVAHKHFSAWCFNRAWDLIEKTDRTEAENRLMEALSHSSIFHWISRTDCTHKNLAVWLLAGISNSSSDRERRGSESPCAHML